MLVNRRTVRGNPIRVELIARPTVGMTASLPAMHPSITLCQISLLRV